MIIPDKSRVKHCIREMCNRGYIVKVSYMEDMAVNICKTGRGALKLKFHAPRIIQDFREHTAFTLTAPDAGVTQHASGPGEDRPELLS